MYYTDYDIVFQEVPDETTLALSISGCPYRCHGCHSSYLWQRDAGTFLSCAELERLIRRYEHSITCVCFMGGDADHYDLNMLMAFIREYYPTLRIAWYSGSDKFPEDIRYDLLSYIKLGHYDATRGPLTSPTTNQRFYAIVPASSSCGSEGGVTTPSPSMATVPSGFLDGLVDITNRFQRK